MTWDLETARERINIIGGDKDTELTAAMTTTVALVENHLDRMFIYADSMEEEFYEVEQRVLHLSRYPIVSVISTDPDPLDGDTYHVNKASGKIIFTGQPYFETVTVTYEGGYATLPSDLEMGLWEVFDSVWAQQYMESTAIQLGAVKKKTIVGVGSIEYETGGEAGRTSMDLISGLAETLLNPYRRISA